MKKISYLILSAILFVPFIVNAQTIEINICQEGCAFTGFDLSDGDLTIDNDVDPDNLVFPIDLVYNIKDNNDYELISLEASENEISSLTINGKGNTLYSNRETVFINIPYVTINNVSLNINSTDTNGFASSDFYKVREDMDSKNYLNNELTLNNVIFSSSSSTIIGGYKAYINDSKIMNPLLAALSDVYISNSEINGTLMAGYVHNGIFHLLPNNIINNHPIREYIKNGDVFPSDTDTKAYYLVLNFSGFEENIPEERANHLYIYQDINKTINESINISEYETEFKNYYEDSIGYDDIKDLPIEWKSENESIAKIDNGVIVPVNAGKVDLVGTRGEDIYTIHLTVEKETIPEKIDKMTIKVPITGSKVKVWIVVVSMLLLGVISICSYIFVKNIKARQTK